MRRKIYHISLIMLVLSGLSPSGFAQVAIKGKLINATTKDPIPDVQIFSTQTKTGTITNLRGEFLLSVSRTLPDTLKISCIGYSTKFIPLSGSEGFLLISLNEHVAHLRTIEVISQDYGKELLKRAIEAIPVNYPATDERLIGSIREIVSLDSARKDIQYLTEAEVEVTKESYKKGNRISTGPVKVVKGRKFVLQKVMSFHSGADLAHRFDAVLRRDGPLYLKNIDRYDYDIIDTLMFMGTPLFVLNFEYKKINGITGQIYIQDSTYAIVKAVYRYEGNGIHWPYPVGQFPERPKGRASQRNYLQFNIAYQKTPSRWQLSRIHYQTCFYDDNNLTFVNTTYTTHKTWPEFKHIPVSEQLQPHAYFVSTVDRYDPNFWDGYTAIVPDEQIENYFQAFAATRTDLDKITKPAELLSDTRLKLKIEEIYNIGVQLYQQQKMEKALAQFEKVIALDPFHKDALFNLAVINHQLGNAGKTVELLQRSVQLRDRQAAALLRKLGHKISYYDTMHIDDVEIKPSFMINGQIENITDDKALHPGIQNQLLDGFRKSDLIKEQVKTGEMLTLSLSVDRQGKLHAKVLPPVPYPIQYEITSIIRSINVIPAKHEGRDVVVWGIPLPIKL